MKGFNVNDQEQLEEILNSPQIQETPKNLKLGYCLWLLRNKRTINEQITVERTEAKTLR